MLGRSLMKYSKSAYSCIMDERAFRANMDDVVADLEKALEFQSRLEKLEEMYQHLKIRLEDVKSATNNFSNPYSPCDDNPRFIRCVAELDHYDREKHSSVGTESEVKLLRRHNTVAIKRLISQDHELDQQVFFNNMEMLASFQHPNIISLLGFCVEGSELILVFEKNPNKHVALCKTTIVEIENFEDAEFIPLNQEDEALYLPYISRNVSPFHLDPEYTKTGLLKRESDVYSFGVVSFELLCGKKAADPIYLDYGGHQTHVARSRFAAGTLESMIDPVIIYPNKDSLDTYTEIAYKCGRNPSSTSIYESCP
ncbi:hypothetical protein R6Q59_006925 [Mikania micrantha]